MCPSPHRALEMSISRCPRGCVRVSFGPAVVHLGADEFEAFCALVEAARERRPSWPAPVPARRGSA